MRTSSLIARTAIALAFAAGLPSAHAAGVVQVSFVNTDQYTDAGWGSRDVERCTTALGDHLKSLAARLPDGQVLKVKVTDVDLAGEIHPNRSRGEIRVLRGRADWPRIDLEFTLEQNGRSLQTGQARLSDMAYLMNQTDIDRGGDFAYERRMLTRWVDDLVAAKTAP